MAELRKDPVSGSWVVSGYSATKTSSMGDCPFCPGNEHLTPRPIREIKDADGLWIVRVFPASNPIFLIEVPEQKRAEGLYDKMGNVGAHEIIVENRSHTKTMSTFTEREFSLLIDAFTERILDLKRDKRFRHIQVFKNHGELAGSYIFHPHSHVLATPILPQSVEIKLSNARRHYQAKERCLFCDIVSQEIRQNRRIVNINSSFVSFCPYASRVPYEAWVLPRRHNDNFESLREESAKAEFIYIMLDLLKRIEKLTNAYTIVIHTSPNTSKGVPEEHDVALKEYFHWHIEVLPRDFKSSKYKRDDQFYVVPITPEEAAITLKAQRL
jgi:UDPglucose--hexose-1-phosphate uridylyltransferase